MIRERVDCRLCGSAKLESVLQLLPTPIANNYSHAPYAGNFYPLELMQCGECKNVQLRHVIHSDTLYTNYKYSTPPAVIPHLTMAAQKLRERFPHAKTLLEIGSNNGTNLKILNEAGFSVMGIDPSATGEFSQKCNFDDNFISLVSHVANFDIIVANNVFAHIDDLDGVFININKIISECGSVVFEVQYCLGMHEQGWFDMIYHEHHNYHTIKPINKFLKKHGFVLTGFEYLPTHGESIRITAERHGEQAILPLEIFNWSYFRNKISESKKYLTQAISLHKNVAIFGATAKACTLIHHFGIADKISYCFDETPAKIGQYIPGTAIRITNEIGRPDMMLLSAWNYEKIVRERFPNLNIITPFEGIV